MVVNMNWLLLLIDIQYLFYIVVGHGTVIFTLHSQVWLGLRYSNKVSLKCRVKTTTGDSEIYTSR